VSECITVPAQAAVELLATAEYTTGEAEPQVLLELHCAQCAEPVFLSTQSKIIAGASGVIYQRGEWVDGMLIGY
jgi:hypothetical protein